MYRVVLEVNPAAGGPTVRKAYPVDSADKKDEAVRLARLDLQGMDAVGHRMLWESFELTESKNYFDAWNRVTLPDHPEVSK
jgi:hypothetical protein